MNHLVFASELSPTDGIWGKLALFLLLAVATAAFAYELYKRFRLVKLGGAENRFDRVGERIKSVIVYVLGQRRVINRPLGGWAHFTIFWGFLLLAFANIFVIGGGFLPVIEETFRANILGKLYLVLIDTAGLLVWAALAVAAFRRYVLRPTYLEKSFDAAIILILIFFIITCDFLTDTFFFQTPQGNGVEFATYAYVSNFFTGVFPVSEAAAKVLFIFFWWAHLAIMFGFLVYIPLSKHMHLVAGPLNVYFRNLDGYGKATKMDLEDEDLESFGVTKIEEFTWKDLFDLYSCTECGRCYDSCPATQSKKPLNPKDLISDLKKHLAAEGPKLLTKQEAADGEDSGEEEAETAELVENAVEAEAIWACTQCGACQAECPVFIEHPEKILDIRRSLVLNELGFPNELKALFKNVEVNGNPWGVGFDARTEWTKGLDVRILEEGDEVEYLLWVGCSGAYDDRGKKASRALARLLSAAGVDFGIIGNDERCCGDPVRRAGNEYLFQMRAEENVETFAKYKFKHILATCPHGYNTFKREYPDFGGNYSVVHYAELLEELISSGRLELKKGPEAVVSYHDSCYLKRVNDLGGPPRRVLKSIPGVKFREVVRPTAETCCCGGGGGRMFMEETLGDRINHMRVKEAIDSGTGLLSAACPFCNTMIADGILEIGAEDKLKSADIAEIVLEAAELPGESAATGE